MWGGESRVQRVVMSMMIAAMYGSHAEAQPPKTKRLALQWRVYESDSLSPICQTVCSVILLFITHFYRYTFLKLFSLQVISLGSIWPPCQFWEAKMKMPLCLKVLEGSKFLKMHQLHPFYCCCLKSKWKSYPFIFSSSTIHRKLSETKVLWQHLPSPLPPTRGLYILRRAINTVNFPPIHPIIHPSVSLSICLSIWWFTICLSIYPTFLLIHLSIPSSLVMPHHKTPLQEIEILYQCSDSSVGH